MKHFPFGSPRLSIDWPPFFEEVRLFGFSNTSRCPVSSPLLFALPSHLLLVARLFFGYCRKQRYHHARDDDQVPQP